GEVAFAASQGRVVSPARETSRSPFQGRHALAGGLHLRPFQKAHRLAAHRERQPDPSPGSPEFGARSAGSPAPAGGGGEVVREATASRGRQTRTERGSARTART